jgi:sialic acid synthase SpsE
VSLFLIAEIGINHNGQLDIAKQLIDASVDVMIGAIVVVMIGAMVVVLIDAIV